MSEVVIAEQQIDFKKHFLFLAGPILVLIYSGYLLVVDYRDDYRGTQSTTRVATVQKAVDDVKRRPPDRFRWFNVDSQQGLYANDSLRTGAGSHASLLFENGTKLELEEKSLIVMEESKAHTSIHFLGGKMSFSGGGKNGLIVRSQNRTLDLSNAEGEISNQNDVNVLHVNKGTVTIANGKEKEEIKQQEELHFNTEGNKNIVKIQVDLIAPLDGTAILTTNTSQNTKGEVEFNWKTLSTLHELKIEIADNPQFISPLMTSNAQKQNITLNFPPGTYYWRLRENVQVASETRKFTVEKRIPIALVQPENHKHISQNDHQEIYFNWISPPYYRNYTLKVSQDEKFQKIVQSEKIRQDHGFALTLNNPGHYYWRIEASSDTSGSTEISVVHEFDLEIKAPAIALQKPQINSVPTTVPTTNPIPTVSPVPIPISSQIDFTLLTPRQGMNVVPSEALSRKGEVSVPFKWKTLLHLENPHLVLWKFKTADSEERKEILNVPVESKLGSGSYVGVLNSPGYYGWTILKGGDSTHSSVKDFEKFHLLEEFEGIQTKTPEVKAKRDYNTSSKNSVNLIFRWNPIPDAKSYRISIYDSEGAEKPLLETNTDLTKFISDNEVLFRERVYYQISTLIPTGFRVKSKLLSYKFNGATPTLTLVPNDTVFKKSSVTNPKNPVIFTWKKTAISSSFVFEVSNTRDFAKVVAHENLKTNYFVFNPYKLHNGKYYWRVWSVSASVMSPPSKQNWFFVKP